MNGFTQLTLLVLMTISTTSICQNRTIKIDIIDTQIDFSFGTVTTEKLRNKNTLMLYAPDSIGPISVVLLDSNLNIYTIGKYSFVGNPVPVIRILEDLDTGERTYINVLKYDTTRSGIWLFINQTGEVYKKEEY